MAKSKKANLDPANFDYADIVKQVAQAQIATQHIPGLVKQELEKNWKQLPNTDPKRSLKSWTLDPLSLQYSLGYKDRRFSLTYDTLKRVVQQLSILNAIINLRSAQVAAFSEPYRKTRSLGFVIKHKDPEHPTTRAEVAFIKELEDFISNCGRSEKNPYSRVRRDSFDEFLRKIVRDSLTMDQCCAEIIPDQLGLPFEFYAVDASTIRLASDSRYIGVNASYQEREGFVPSLPQRFAGLYEGRQYGITNAEGELISYVQIVNGQIENVYSEKELMFGVRNPRTDIYVQNYGYGEVEQLITIVTAHLNAEEYQRKLLSQGTLAKGILNFKGDNFTPDTLEAFRRMWSSMMSGVENCIAGTSTIFTQQHGCIEIGKLLENKDNEEVSIWTGKKWSPALVFKTKDKKRLCHTKLNNGVTISTSPDHKFQVIDDSGDPVWKRQEELNLGDTVLLNKINITSKVDNVPSFNGKKLTVEMMEVLGWMIGDGYLVSKGKKNQIDLFYHHEKELGIHNRHFKFLSNFNLPVRDTSRAVSEEQREIIKERYGFKTVASSRVRLSLNNSEFVRWLLSIGFTSSTEGKSIPYWLFTSSIEYKSAFLKGLFSADGHNEQGRYPRLEVASSKLRRQVKILLLSMGIRTTVSEGKNKLVINGRERSYEENKHFLIVKDREEFKNLIGFLQEHKQFKSDKNAIEIGKADLIPKSTVLKYIKLIKDTGNLTNAETHELGTISNILKGGRNCSKTRLLRFMKKFEVNIPSWLLETHTTSVVEIDRTDTYIDMYDVTVYDEDHTFSCDGALVHNSHKTAILQSEGIDWIDITKSNLDMEFSRWVEYLLKVTCGVFLVDPSEINFDLSGGITQTPLFESSQEWKLKASRDKGLKPLLKFLSRMINKNIIDRIDSHFTLEFVGLDELSETEKHEMRIEKLSSYLTLNEVRRELDLSELPYGDIPMSPTYIAAMQAQQEQQQPSQEAGSKIPKGNNKQNQTLDQLPHIRDNTELNSKPKYSDAHSSSEDDSTGV